MAVDSTTRRVVYAGNGKTTAFPFAFKVFEESDVAVAVGVADSASSSSSSLEYDTDFTVVLNGDQETNPGGTVTVKTAPETGVTLAITSAVPYDQPMVLTPFDGFNPETLNDNSDRQCAQIQQLAEELSRAITTDATDTMTPAELKQKLLDAAETATVVAKGYADQAQESAEQAKASEKKTAEYAEAATIVAPIATEVKTVADAVSDVKTVSTNIEAVKTVAENVKTVAGVADDMKVVAANVDAVKTVSGISEDVSTVAKNADEVVAVGKQIDDVHDAAQLLPHADDIGAIKGHLDEVHKVGQDLLGVNSADFDCGEIGDELDSITTVVDGYIKKVAEHIDDCVHPVGEDLEVIELVAENLDPINRVNEIMTTDYEKIFNEGVD